MPSRDKPSHRRIDGQIPLALAIRDGPQRCMTPDRRRNNINCGISPTFPALMRRRPALCRSNELFKRVAGSVAVNQNGLVDKVAALDTAHGPKPVSSPAVHAMLIDKQAPAPQARTCPVSRMGDRRIRRSIVYLPRDAGTACHRSVHKVLHVDGDPWYSCIAHMFIVHSIALRPH